MDVGGAADLQTDVMRFMAIISLCLVAIFALVQSMPVTPVAAPTVVEAIPQAVTDEQVVAPPPAPESESVPEKPAANVLLTRPTWTPKYQAQVAAADPPVAVADTAPAMEPEIAAPAPQEADGFTLRFESDAALMRLVAASQVGVYAIDRDSARRMAVSESRISFWDASMPNSFHEMEVSTVPAPVIDALARSGADSSGVSWGVTLPGKLKTQLEDLMQQHRGGSLLIGANGQIRLEES
jgi:hypothetical protein